MFSSLLPSFPSPNHIISFVPLTQLLGEGYEGTVVERRWRSEHEWTKWNDWTVRSVLSHRFIRSCLAHSRWFFHFTPNIKWTEWKELERGGVKGRRSGETDTRARWIIDLGPFLSFGSIHCPFPPVVRSSCFSPLFVQDSLSHSIKRSETNHHERTEEWMMGENEPNLAFTLFSWLVSFPFLCSAVRPPPTTHFHSVTAPCCWCSLLIFTIESEVLQWEHEVGESERDERHDTTPPFSIVHFTLRFAHFKLGERTTREWTNLNWEKVRARKRFTLLRFFLLILSEWTKWMNGTTWTQRTKCSEGECGWVHWYVHSRLFISLPSLTFSPLFANEGNEGRTVGESKSEGYGRVNQWEHWALLRSHCFPSSPVHFSLFPLVRLFRALTHSPRVNKRENTSDWNVWVNRRLGERTQEQL